MHLGSCLCRGVSYEVSELSESYVYCHCTSCRKASGSAFAANASAPVEGFRILTGEDLLAVYESSPQKRRFFCGVCGTPIFTRVGEASAQVRVRLGTLDTEFSVRPTGHIFVDEKAAWYEISDTRRQFSEWPDPSELEIPGSKQTKTDESV